MTMQGTITNGVISGTWSQTSGESGTFTANGAISTTYTAKGLAFYSDANDYYVVAVRSVSVGTGTGVDAGKPQAWFAGEVVDTNNAEWMPATGSPTRCRTTEPPGTFPVSTPVAPVSFRLRGRATSGGSSSTSARLQRRRT